MKIGVIFTGGTIGSTVGDDGYIAVQKGKYYRLLQMYEEKYGDGKQQNDYEKLRNVVDGYDIEFVTKEPYKILSENLDFEHIKILATTVKNMLDVNKLEDKASAYSVTSPVLVNQDNSYRELDGIIITHGTDSLQYGAAFLKLLLGKIDIPVLLVSSAYVLDDPSANGLDNFVLAISYIVKGGEPGVYISYVNEDGTKVVCPADKALAHPTFGADISMAEVSAKNDDHSYHEIDIQNIKFKNVAFLHAYPGMDMGILQALDFDKIDAILIESYHSGTMPVGESIGKIVKNAGEKGVPVFLVGIKSTVKQYESVLAYEKLGIIPLFDETPIMAYCKLCLGFI